MIRFYKYVVYRLYDFFGRKDSTPIVDTVLVLFMVHGFQLVTLWVFFGLIFDLTANYFPRSFLFYLSCLLISVVYYFLVFYNGKYKNWFKEFKKETDEQRKKNGIKVWLFCWGSIILFFIQAAIIIAYRNYYNR
jgi:hypothetical protein